MKVIGLFLTLIVFFGIGAIYWSTHETQNEIIPESYRIMDDLESNSLFGRGIQFQDFDGAPAGIDQYKGKILILSFWATWCQPCVDEFPSFVKLLEAYPDKIVLVAISHDEKPQDVRDFITAFAGWKKNLVVVFDKEQKVSQEMGVGLLPEGYIFNREGKLVKKILGIQDWASAEALSYFKKF